MPRVKRFLLDLTSYLPFRERSMSSVKFFPRDLAGLLAGFEGADILLTFLIQYVWIEYKHNSGEDLDLVISDLSDLTPY